MREVQRSQELPNFIQHFVDNAESGVFPYRDIQHLKDDVEDMEVSIQSLGLADAQKQSIYDAVKKAYFQYKENYKLSVEA